MEQKKILWILLSVTLFLFVVSVVGVVWFYPGKVSVADSTDPVETQDKAAVDFDPVEWIRQGEDFPGLIENSQDKEGGFTIIYGETDNGTSPPDIVVDSELDRVSDNSAGSAIASSLPDTAVSVKPEPVKEVTRTANTAAPAPRKVNVLEYWIQAGSYSSRSRAESSGKLLAEKGLANLITIKTVDGKDYYRVRMGPYLSKAEAEKFLLWVKDIDSYEKSYISQVYVQKTVN